MDERAHGEQEGLSESFSEERFSSLPTGVSWESQSFDSEARPSSRTSLRDRRKQFDLTTPTLIDEGDCELAEQNEMNNAATPSREESEISLLEQRQSARPSDDSVLFGEMRRTPGASMYKSSYDSSLKHGGTMAQSTEHGKESLGFGLTLSTPVAASDTVGEIVTLEGKQGATSGKPPSWDKTLQGKQLAEEHATSETSPFTPPPPIQAGSGPRLSVGEPRGPFSFAPWARAPQGESSYSGEGRAGAFSPNTLRLREDLGNLLQDADDDYALAIRSAFREGGNKDDDQQQGGGWTGSYVFDASSGARPSVPRNYVNQMEAKQRRRSGNDRFLSHTQQPKPRRGSNEVFEFGKTPTGDDEASPQLINFGGAFVPPASFVKPHTVSSDEGAFSRPQVLSRSQDTGEQHQGSVLASACHPNPLFAPTPSTGSEMQATAHEFVPMTHHAPTQLHHLHFVPGAHPGSSFEGSSIDQQSWHTVIPTEPNYVYHASAYDHRAGMTPSPHLVGWQTQEAAVYAPVPQNTHFDQHNSFALPVSLTPTPSLQSQASAEISHHQHQQRKRETKRGKRGKKKAQREKEASGKRTPVRRKGKEGSGRPFSSNQNQELQVEDWTASADEPTDSKRSELIESPATKSAFKDFYRTFRLEERISFGKAEGYARQVIDSGQLPAQVLWRVYLELADLAKRSNRFSEARRLYKTVCELQPYAFQGWLEYSKLEEECGNMSRVTNILYAGLKFCDNSETLLTRSVKIYEKLEQLNEARALLSRLKQIAIDKVWKTVLEGSLMEARAGNFSTSRKALKYLMHHVPWYGPLYLEAYRLERDQRNLDDALNVVQRGLHAIPRYGPLWFGAFRLCEEIDISRGCHDLPTVVSMIERATGSISKELIWKVHLEAAQMYERAALRQEETNESLSNEMLNASRNRFALTLLTCPNSLRWKVWLASARVELSFGNEKRARRLFKRAHEAVPEKGRSSTILECARIEEFFGDVELARSILCKGRVFYGHDWKVWLESVLLEIRDRSFKRAIDICSKALEIHGGTGRLWASLVQLQLFGGGARTQELALKRALNAVPKSGEVWCEGSRVRLNPFSGIFDLFRARRHLQYATKFTPQYGDSFVEGIRLEILYQWLEPVARYIWEETRASFKPIDRQDNSDRLTKYITDVTLTVSVAVHGDKDTVQGFSKVPYLVLVAKLKELLSPRSLHDCIDLSGLRLACANADPNYGSLWFFCRRGTCDPPRTVFEFAAERLAEDVVQYAHIYLAAIIRRKAILSMHHLEEVPVNVQENLGVNTAEACDWEKKVDESLLAYATLNEMFNPVDPTTGVVLLGSTMDGSLFVCGITELNRDKKVASMNLEERKRAIFGNDALFP